MKERLVISVLFVGKRARGKMNKIEIIIGVSITTIIFLLIYFFYHPSQSMHGTGGTNEFIGDVIPK